MNNQRVVLASRPTGAPSVDNFRLETVPAPEPKEGEVLIKTLYLSLDPYMRLRMNDGDSYADPVGIGEVMFGGTVGRVLTSRHEGFAEGDLVAGYTGWQTHAVSSHATLSKLPANMPQPSLALSVLGMPGFTAHYGLLSIGRPKPGETVVVGAATGAVGSVVGQVAKLKGCRVVGVAGGVEKCAFAVNELGFDACVDHRSPNLAGQLEAACPQGIDVYFENVGGDVLRAVLPLLNDFARVPLCGVIAWYDGEHSAKPLLAAELMGALLVRRVEVRAFIILDHYRDHYAGFARDMSAWVAAGTVKVREDVAEGLENAPAAFIGMLQGRNFGKALVRVATD